MHKRKRNVIDVEGKRSLPKSMRLCSNSEKIAIERNARLAQEEENDLREEVEVLRRGKKNEFEIIWVSRFREVDSFGQYFTHMKWLALPPQEAMGQRGQYLGEKFKVTSIPTLVLLDEIGNVITFDGRNKIPMDKAGVGFPWRSPMSVLISTLVPKSFRLLVKSQIQGILEKAKAVLGGAAARGGAAAAAVR